MQIGSRAFIAIMAAVSAAALAGGYLLNVMPLTWCGVVVGSYTLHLASVATAGKSAASSSPTAVRDAEMKALGREREEVERLRQELERKSVQAEEQWRLLRSMVRQRVRGISGEGQASGQESEPPASGSTVPGRSSDKRSGVDDPGRSYGRW